MSKEFDHWDSSGEDKEFVVTALLVSLVKALIVNVILGMPRLRSTISFRLTCSVLSEGGTTASSLRRMLHSSLLQWVKFISSDVFLRLCNFIEFSELNICSPKSRYPVSSKSLLSCSTVYYLRKPCEILFFAAVCKVSVNSFLFNGYILNITFDFLLECFPVCLSKVPSVEFSCPDNWYLNAYV